MTTQLSLPSMLQHFSWSKQSTWTAGPASVRARFIALTGLVTVWRQRIYYREELKRLAQHGAQRIDDVGLTMPIVAAELQKPFWQA